jgi:peptidoglycan/LPS O-acetylase OafA/YrhL
MPSPPARPHLKHIPELDGIRGVAALMVLCHHLFFTSIPDPERWNGFVLFLSRLSHAGGNGVDLFFVLSGFLITSLLLLDRGSPHFYWNFYWKRALRIFPLYFAALLLLAVFWPASWRYTLLSFLFLANFAQLFHVASAGPFWTLAIEEQFYLIWPRFAARLSVAALERLALGIVIASPALRLIAAAFGHHNYEFTFFHADGLALGALLACQELRKRDLRNQKLPRQSEDTGSPRARSALSSQMLLVLLAVALIALPPILSLWLAPESDLLFGTFALQVSGISLLAYSIIAAAVRHSGSPLLAVFRSRVLTFFGLISYCLYIANGYAVNVYDHFAGPMRTGDMRAYAIRAAAVFAATLIVCILSRYLIEQPAMSLRRHVLRRP